jgi:hypothetical protein
MAVTNLTITALAASQFQDTTNANAAIVVKNSGGTFFLISIDNTANAAISYVKLFYTAGAVVVGTTVPDWVIPAPASLISPIVCAPGIVFAAGLQVATVTAGGTAGAVSPASAVVVRIVYT